MKKISLSCLLGILTGWFSCTRGVSRLFNFYQNDINKFDIKDLFNMIFVTDEFELYGYMAKNSPMLFFIPFTFFLSGMIIASSEFLFKPKEYHAMVCSRSKNIKKSMEIIKGNCLVSVSIFVISYFISIIIVSSIKYPELWIKIENERNYYLIRIFLYMLVKIITIMVISSGTFLIYIWKNESIAFLSGIVIVVALFLVDMVFSSVNLVLYRYDYYYADSIIIMLFILFSFDWIWKYKLKICLLD